MSLGENFPENFRKEFAGRQIKIGNVIRAFVNITNPPKEKYFVVIGITKDKNIIGLSFINSNINLNVHNTPELYNLQYKITKDQNSFLDNDSYIDCSDIKEIPHSEIEEKVVQSPEMVKGAISNQDLNQCLNLLKISPKLTRKQLKKFDLI